MNADIKEKIDSLDLSTRARVLDTIAALDNGKGRSIEFYSDGSGVCLENPGSDDPFGQGRFDP